VWVPWADDCPPPQVIGISEARDLAKDKPEKAAELRELLHNWRESVDAQMPAPNPEFKR